MTPIQFIGRKRHFVDDHWVIEMIEMIEIMQDSCAISWLEREPSVSDRDQNDRNRNRRNAQNPFNTEL